MIYTVSGGTLNPTLTHLQQFVYVIQHAAYSEGRK